MINNKFDEIVNLVESWVPEKDYSHEKRFQRDLHNYLEEQLEAKGSGFINLGMQNRQEDYVEAEDNKSLCDLAVNDNIGIELKRDFSRSSFDRAVGQIERHKENYDYVIVCTCGVDDLSSWNKLKNKFSNKGMNIRLQQGTPVVFVRKKKENYGKDSSSNQGGLGLGLGGDNGLI